MTSGKTPKIRFKGFTEDWEQRKYSFLADTRRGLTYTPSNVRKKGIRVLRSSNITNDFLSCSDDDVFVEINAINIDYAKNNDILITAANGSSRLVGKHALIKDISSNSAVHGGFMLLAIPKENAHFLNASMSSNWYKKFIELYVSGGNGAIGNLNKSDLDNQEVYTPKIEEQDKIGKIFEQLDNLITLHQRKYENLLNIKNSLLDKMFPKNGLKIPEIRFKDFTDDWEQRKLDDFGIATGGTSIESEFSDNGIYKVISIGSYSENSTYNDQGIKAIHSDKTKNRVLNKNDLTMILNDKTASGKIIGRVLFIDKSKKYVYNQRTERIEVNQDLYNSRFIYHLLNAPNNRNKIIKQSQGNTQIFVNWTSIKNTEYLIPSMEEQKELVIIFNNLDNLITLHQQKLEKLKNIKQSLLDNMFV